MVVGVKVGIGGGGEVVVDFPRELVTAVVGERLVDGDSDPSHESYQVHMAPEQRGSSEDGHQVAEDVFDRVSELGRNGN